MVVVWCWDDVGTVVDDASELPVGLTSVVGVPLLGTLGFWDRSRNIISKIFLQVTFSFSLD